MIQAQAGEKGIFLRLNIVEDEVLAAIALGVRRTYSSEGIRIDTFLEKTWEHQMPSELCDLLASSSDVLISQRHGNGACSAVCGAVASAASVAPQQRDCSLRVVCRTGPLGITRTNIGIYLTVLVYNWVGLEQTNRKLVMSVCNF